MKAESLKLNKDFKRLYYRGKSVVCRNVVVYVMKNRSTKSRLGLTCGKSVGKAVVRNRVKRLMRESYRLLEIQQGYDVVIVARTRAKDATYAQISEDIKYSFRKTGILK